MSYVQLKFKIYKQERYLMTLERVKFKNQPDQMICLIHYWQALIQSLLSFGKFLLIT